MTGKSDEKKNKKIRVSSAFRIRNGLFVLPSTCCRCRSGASRSPKLQVDLNRVACIKNRPGVTALFSYITILTYTLERFTVTFKTIYNLVYYYDARSRRTRPFRSKIRFFLNKVFFWFLFFEGVEKSIKRRPGGTLTNCMTSQYTSTACVRLPSTRRMFNVVLRKRLADARTRARAPVVIITKYNTSAPATPPSRNVYGYTNFTYEKKKKKTRYHYNTLYRRTRGGAHDVHKWTIKHHVSYGRDRDEGRVVIRFE